MQIVLMLVTDDYVRPISIDVFQKALIENTKELY